MGEWKDAQKFESEFWGDCCNTLSEELKQRVYAQHMGLELIRTCAAGFGYDLGGKFVIDMGGGPTSLLLKCVNRDRGYVIDPCKFPEWVGIRYNAAHIGLLPIKGEDFNPAPLIGLVNEVWCYNLLQHTEDPGLIIAHAKKVAPRLRIFEWVDLPVYEGHPQEITQAKLEQWIGQSGMVSTFSGENECYGRAFHGVFDHARNSA